MKARVTCTYLYADGHAVMVFEKTDPQAGLVQWCEVWERWTEASLGFTGRIVIGRYSGGLAALCRGAEAIRAKVPKVDESPSRQGTQDRGNSLVARTRTPGERRGFLSADRLLPGEIEPLPGLCRPDPPPRGIAGRLESCSEYKPNGRPYPMGNPPGR